MQKNNWGLGLFNAKPRPVPAPEPEPDPKATWVVMIEGQEFRPLDIADGHARLIISRVPLVVDGETVYGTSVDFTNMDRDFVLRLYRDAEMLVRQIDDAARAVARGE